MWTLKKLFLASKAGYIFSGLAGKGYDEPTWTYYQPAGNIISWKIDIKNNTTRLITCITEFIIFYLSCKYKSFNRYTYSILLSIFVTKPVTARFYAIIPFLTSRCSSLASSWKIYERNSLQNAYINADSINDTPAHKVVCCSLRLSYMQIRYTLRTRLS